MTFLCKACACKMVECGTSPLWLSWLARRIYVISSWGLVKTSNYCTQAKIQPRGRYNAFKDTRSKLVGKLKYVERASHSTSTKGASLPHQPVMLDEVIRFLAPSKGQTIVDATLGAGGYSLAILKAMEGNGRVIGLDCDKRAIRIARKRILKNTSSSSLTYDAFSSSCFETVHTNFVNIAEAMKKLGIQKVDGVVADLGVSSMVLDGDDDKNERGFSFKSDAKLDMRLNCDQDTQTAADLLNGCSTVLAVTNLLFPYTRDEHKQLVEKLAPFILKNKPYHRTTELVNAVHEGVVSIEGQQCYEERKGWIQNRTYHPLTQYIFTTLRMQVNEEITNLKKLCEVLPSIMRPGGKFICVSFNRWEEAVLREHIINNRAVWNMLTEGGDLAERSYDEHRSNGRARSAKLCPAVLLHD